MTQEDIDELDDHLPFGLSTVFETIIVIDSRNNEKWIVKSISYEKDTITLCNYKNRNHFLEMPICKLLLFDCIIIPILYDRL